MTYQFPAGFWWGGASSAPQSEGAAAEGGKGKTIWDHWYELEPERFYQKVGPNDTDDFFHRYEEDVELMCKAGFNSFRTSLSWARLIPDGDGEVNQEGVQFYRRMISCLREHGIRPVLNLYHFDMPLALQQQGGWENRHTVDAFVRYASFCFDTFGDLAEDWLTFNEPIVPVEGGYLYGFHYPAVCDMKRAVQVGYHTMLASAGAIAQGRAKHPEFRFGIVLNLTPSYPRDAADPGDAEASRIADLLFNRSFLTPSVRGCWPEGLGEILGRYGWLPERAAGEKEILEKGTIDFLGVNYYQPRRVQKKQTPCSAPKLPEDLFSYYQWEDAEMNTSRGWEIYPKGVYDIAVMLRDEYGNLPWYISENGIGIMDEEQFADETGMILDDYRIRFIRRHLTWLAQAMQEGCACFGYHIWTFLDNWSWCNAFKNRYGLVRLDKEHGNARIPKRSFAWFAQTAAINSIELEKGEMARYERGSLSQCEKTMGDNGIRNVCALRTFHL